ncbi:hypothetical protein CCM_03664 [Cordyceps militaris CM01]|uniref:Uncharacterized protein n=1 Tax=Cordyceps militaris (strain CM01) TaxID=983644 RepID=G3JFR0_CORMM|nr:uncharacterized protein CCM_03664 [Cordyceps militaris CM01]EGX92293.1 hypothetical protein CCM_03664 [Cordyceps militaris CM01]
MYSPNSSHVSGNHWMRHDRNLIKPASGARAAALRRALGTMCNIPTTYGVPPKTMKFKPATPNGQTWPLPYSGATTRTLAVFRAAPALSSPLTRTASKQRCETSLDLAQTRTTKGIIVAQNAKVPGRRWVQPRLKRVAADMQGLQTGWPLTRISWAGGRNRGNAARPFGGAAGLSSHTLANSVSFSTSAAAQANLFMRFPVDSIASTFLTSITAPSSLTPQTVTNPLDPRATTLDALLDTSTRLQITISPTLQTTSTTALARPATNAVDIASEGPRAAPTTKATATAEAAAATAKVEAKIARRQTGEADTTAVPQSESADIDPAKGPFPGGVPTAEDDVLITAIFLILFALGAFTHISIFRANSKRGHKFLISDLMFDFCMVRVMTCIFRIVWAFSSPRGVVLAATIFQNGGTAVIFAVNLFLAQRLVRSMHPAFGWRPAFSCLSLFLIFSVPAVIVMNIIATAVSFFSVGKPVQLQAVEGVLKFGASWNMMLVAMPLLWVFLASATAHSSSDGFGVGHLSRKGSLLVFSAITLAVGSVVKLVAISNPASVAAMSPLFTKSAFYTTGFMLEILTVAAYAHFRIDLTFHIPNGASGPGDYSLPPSDKPRSWTAGEVVREIGKIGVRYELLSSHSGQGNRQGPVLALLYLDATENDVSVDAELDFADLRSARVSRRQSFMEAIRPKEPARAKRSAMYITEKQTPSLFNE